MPQGQHHQVLLSSALSFTLLVLAFPNCPNNHFWQLWLFLGFIGIELRLLIDEKQKRTLFHQESQLNQKQGQEGNFLLQIQDFSEKDPEMLKSIEKDIHSPSKFSPHEMESKMPSFTQIGIQQTIGGRIHTHCEKLPQVSTSLLAVPMFGQDSSIQIRNDRGISFFQNRTTDGTQTKENRSSIASNLKKNASVFQISKGVEEAKKAMQISFMLQESSDHQQGFGKGQRNTSEHNFGQLSPFFGNSLNELTTFAARSQAVVQSNSMIKWLPFSVIQGSFDNKKGESIIFLSSNEKAKTNYQISDQIRLEEFLLSCKMSSNSNTNSFHQSSSNLKRVLINKFVEMIEDRQQNCFNYISPNQSVFPYSPLKKSQKPASGLFPYGIDSKSALGSLTNFQGQQEKQRNSIRSLENNIKSNSISSSHPQNINISGKPTTFEFLIEIGGMISQETQPQNLCIAKLIIFKNDEFMLLLDDDNLQKSILQTNKRVICKQLLQQVEKLANRVHNIQQLIVNGIGKKKDIFFDNYLLVNYLVNVGLSLKEQLDIKQEVHPRQLLLQQAILKTKQIIQRSNQTKSVNILINNNIPSDCTTIVNDSFYLSHILTNLIENSYNNTKFGFVQILVHQSKIFSNNIRIDIIDSGSGINQQILNVINQNQLMLSSQTDEIISDSKILNEQSNKIYDENNLGGYGIQFSQKLIKLLGPYNRLHAESIKGVGSRVSFVIYKQYIPQNVDDRPEEVKSDDFDKEMLFFNPIYSSQNKQTNYPLKDYINYVLESLFLDLNEGEQDASQPPCINKPIISLFNSSNIQQSQKSYLSSSNKANDLCLESNFNSNSNQIISNTNSKVNKNYFNEMNKQQKPKSFESQKLIDQKGIIKSLGLQESKGINGQNNSSLQTSEQCLVSSVSIRKNTNSASSPNPFHLPSYLLTSDQISNSVQINNNLKKQDNNQINDDVQENNIPHIMTDPPSMVVSPHYKSDKVTLTGNFFKNEPINFNSNNLQRKVYGNVYNSNDLNNAGTTLKNK